MTQNEFSNKAMLALLANPSVTNLENFDDREHLEKIRDVASIAACLEDMYFDDLNTLEAEHFPECVSERECLAVIAEGVQAIANHKSIHEQQQDNNGNFQYYEGELTKKATENSK